MPAAAVCGLRPKYSEWVLLHGEDADESERSPDAKACDQHQVGNRGNGADEPRLLLQRLLLELPDEKQVRSCEGHLRHDRASTQKHRPAGPNRRLQTQLQSPHRNADLEDAKHGWELQGGVLNAVAVFLACRIHDRAAGLQRGSFEDSELHEVCDRHDDHAAERHRKRRLDQGAGSPDEDHACDDRAAGPINGDGRDNAGDADCPALCEGSCGSEGARRHFQEEAGEEGAGADVHAHLRPALRIPTHRVQLHGPQPRADEDDAKHRRGRQRFRPLR
mmetsp:Transcript_81146/g.225810  ORF Transcript_81146/g.225810 Transcript_81146/m.225810 type:complete len:276 (-) Transcript_81146:419-1246(-)